MLIWKIWFRTLNLSRITFSVPISEAKLDTGAFVGLTVRHGLSHLVRAVLEGVAFNLYGVFTAMSESVRSIDSIDAVGGGAKGDVWLQLMADTWGVPVRRRTIVDEANSLGAAVIGAKAVGLVDDWAAACELSEVQAVFEPDEGRHATDNLRFLDRIYSDQRFDAAVRPGE